MNYLDLYLQRNNCKRYDVYKKTGVSQQLLSTHTNKKVEKYSGKVLMAIASTLGKTPGDVLNDLIALEKENPVFEVFNPAEFLIGLKSKENIIVVRGVYGKEIYNLMKCQLSENETLGFELGSAGVITIMADAINAVRDLFSNTLDSSKTDRDIEKKLRLYKLEEFNEDKLVLRLKQLDY